MDGKPLDSTMPVRPWSGLRHRVARFNASLLKRATRVAEVRADSGLD